MITIASVARGAFKGENKGSLKGRFKKGRRCDRYQQISGAFHGGSIGFRGYQEISELFQAAASLRGYSVAFKGVRWGFRRVPRGLRGVSGSFKGYRRSQGRFKEDSGYFGREVYTQGICGAF